ncbi:MAG: sugar phosphate isomerase/epimerase [Gemmataceae bacterium]|nr:sugar phosphate isomerase/epimerase [Gemmataceae bacterium]
MILGYNTNGFAHHRLDDAVEIIAELGYGGVALTLDVHHLDPYAPDVTRRMTGSGRRLHELGLRCVVETGARFLLDPRRKHQPTLLSDEPADRERRLTFLEDCVAYSGRGDLESYCVSFWSGAPTGDARPAELMARLAEGCKRLADFAAANEVRLAFEPEPGMFIDTLDKFAELHAKVNHPAFGLTADVGHLVCNGELPVSKHLVAWKDVLWNVHIEDMRAGVHDHLMFGEGEVDFADVFAGLRAAGYAGVVSVELSRHSHDAVNTARKAKAFLDPFLASGGRQPPVAPETGG